MIDEIVKAALPQWRRLHPQVDIEVVSRQYGDHHPAMTTALSTSVYLPDVMALEASYVGRFSQGYGLEDLSQAPYSVEQLADRFVPYAFDQTRNRRGARVAVPTDIGPGTLLYRTDLLARTGLSEADVALAMASESRIMWLGIDPLAGNQLTIHEVGSAVAKGPAEPCTAPADTVTPIPSRPDIGVASSHAGDFQVGVAASYVLTVDNVGTGPNTGVITVHHDLPDGITFVGSAGASEWTCSTFVQRVTCFRTGVLAAGNSDSVTIEVAVSALAVPGGPAISAVSTPLDRDPANNRAIDPTVVLA